VQLAELTINNIEAITGQENVIHCKWNVETIFN